MDGQGHQPPGDADVLVGHIASAYEDGPGLSGRNTHGYPYPGHAARASVDDGVGILPTN